MSSGWSIRDRLIRRKVGNADERMVEILASADSLTNTDGMWRDRQHRQRRTRRIDARQRPVAVDWCWHDEPATSWVSMVNEEKDPGDGRGCG